MKTPTEVSFLQLEARCCDVPISKWNQLMKGAVRADKKKINYLVKIHLPDLYEALALNYRNPYHYYKTKTHLILVHSAIEYFIRFVR